jgi:hypothetical protein
MFKLRFFKRRRTVAAKFGLANSFASKANSDPAAQLTAEILDASVVCALQLEAGTARNAPATPDSASSTFPLATEFAAAFTSLALDLMLIEEHRGVLRAKLLFLLPDDVKDKFIEREEEYAACTEVMVADKPLTGTGVVNRMALHLASLCGSSFNREILRQSAVIFANISRELNLRELVLACVG